MDLGLRGRIALVAGASRGLGRAVAEALAAEGAELVLCSRGEGPLREAADAIERASGVRVVACPANLGDPAQVERVIDAALGTFGRVDVLVTNTGGPPPGPFASHSREAWHEAVRQLRDSVLARTRAVLPGTTARAWRRSVNVTSTAVKQPV